MLNRSKQAAKVVPSNEEFSIMSLDSSIKCNRGGESLDNLRSTSFIFFKLCSNKKHYYCIECIKKKKSTIQIERSKVVIILCDCDQCLHKYCSFHGFDTHICGGDIMRSKVARSDTYRQVYFAPMATVYLPLQSLISGDAGENDSSIKKIFKAHSYDYSQETWRRLKSQEDRGHCSSKSI